MNRELMWNKIGIGVLKWYFFSGILFAVMQIVNVKINPEEDA